MVNTSTVTILTQTGRPKKAQNRTWMQLRKNWAFWISAVIVAFFAFIAIFPGVVAGLFGNGNPRVCDLAFSGLGPAPGHPFGYTIQGCDLYASVIHGARASIGVGVITTLGCGIIAVVLGILAGYFGGWIDSVISRFSEIVFAVPMLLGAIVILNSLESRSVLLLSLVLILFAWPISMRVMRSSVMSVRKSSYITAAVAVGMSTPKVLMKHVLLNTLGPVLVLATLQIGGIISAEATLTYLGIGLQPPAQSWGLQLSSAQSYFVGAPHLLIFPALALTVAVTGFVVLGEALRSATKMGATA